MPRTDKLVVNFSPMWELLNVVNCNYKLIRSSTINIAVKIDSRYVNVTNSSDRDRTESGPTMFQPSMCLISSLTVLLCYSSYNLGDNLGSLPSFHILTISHLGEQIWRKKVCWGYTISLPWFSLLFYHNYAGNAHSCPLQ